MITERIELRGVRLEEIRSFLEESGFTETASGEWKDSSAMVRLSHEERVSIGSISLFSVGILFSARSPAGLEILQKMRARFLRAGG